MKVEEPRITKAFLVRAKFWFQDFLQHCLIMDKFSNYVLPDIVITGYMWLLSTWNVAPVPKELKLLFYFVNLSSQVSDYCIGQCRYIIRLHFLKKT